MDVIMNCNDAYNIAHNICSQVSSIFTAIIDCLNDKEPGQGTIIEKS